MATRSKTPASPAATIKKEKSEAAAAKTAKPAPKKTTATDTPARKTAPRKAVASRVTPDQRRLYVEVAAYHIAERRGFAGGDPLEDWARAEDEIDRLLEQGILKP